MTEEWCMASARRSLGHFKPTEADKINRIGQLRQGVVKVIENPKFSPDVSRKYTIADMITGYGVAEAVRHYYETYGGDKGKKAIVGFGNVGSAAAFYGNGCKSYRYNRQRWRFNKRKRLYF
jgi:hypothetical protein